MKQLAKFTNIRTKSKKFDDVSLEIEDDSEMQCDILDECNSAIMKHIFGSIRDANEPVFYTVEYFDTYFKEPIQENYSTNNKHWYW